MAENAKQSALEQIAIRELEIDAVRNMFHKDDYEYNSENEQAKSTNGQVHGKGSRYVKGHLHGVPDHSKWSEGHPGYDYSNFDTNPNNIGGWYDKMGYDGTGVNAGRNFLFNINIYDPVSSYGKNSVYTEDHVVLRGQYRVNSRDGLNVIRK